MQGIGFDLPLQEWFEFKVPRTKVPKNYIEMAVSEEDDFTLRPSSKVVWLGKKPLVVYSSSKKGEMATLSFHSKREEFSIKANKNQGNFGINFSKKQEDLYLSRSTKSLRKCWIEGF
jgi:hypothetical protein